MSYTSNEWGQIRGLTSRKIIKALLKDGFALDEEVRTERIYRHPDGRKISIHYHTGNETYGPGLLGALIKDAGWTIKDLRRLKLVK